MGENQRDFFPWTETDEYLNNITCNHKYVPSATEYFEYLGTFGSVFASLASIFTAFTLYFIVNGTYRMALMEETKSLKGNVIVILFTYPIASVCSLVSLSVPRTQIWSEGVTQIYLTMALYYLYLLLLEIGRREIKESPSLKLRVGPCCCWPCLPFPSLEMNPTHLSWLQILVLQLPIVQTFIFCGMTFVAAENIDLIAIYGTVLQPISLLSLVFAIYGLTVTTMSLQKVNPGINLRHKTTVLQIVLFFTRFQGWLIKALSGTGLFPCTPPISPQVYSEFTYNALMIIEMLFLSYIARHVYVYAQEDSSNLEVAKDPTPSQENHSSNNEIHLKMEGDDKSHGIRHSDRSNHPTNNNEDELRSSDPPSGGP